MVGGLTILAVGLALIAFTAEADSGQWDFLPGLLVAGVGMGASFALMTTIAMRRVSPDLASPSSAVFNTTRELGSVFGTAAVGALLQTLLSSTMYDAATASSTKLPAAAQQPFVDGFSSIFSGGAQSALQQQPKVLQAVPQSAIDAAHDLVLSTYRHGFTDAPRPSLILPIALVLIAAVACIWLQGLPRASGAEVGSGTTPPEV
jgi:hypothetical protein